MQVKKFEARSMKEALEMVKAQLGPDAIILSARDNKKSYGLMGQGSVEITAAVSEETLQKKKFAESRLRNEDREKLVQSSAKVQKQIIDKMVNKYVQENQKAEMQQKPLTRQRYIDIDDQNETEMHPQSELAGERIKTAAQAAWNAMQTVQIKDAAEISVLKNEIESLKQVIAGFQKVPQTMSGSHPGAEYGLTYDVSHMFQKLTESGIAPEITADLLTQAQESMPAIKLKNKALVDGWIAKKILDTTKIVAGNDHAKYHFFVGPSGSGKTASLVKFASHLMIKDSKKIALLTLDTWKVGATDQLKIYAQILNVPFAVIRNKQEFDRVKQALADYDHVLIDCPGFSLKNMEEISFLRSVVPSGDKMTAVHLVLSSLAKDSDLNEIGKRYKVIQFTDLIFTSIDESIQHGNIYNFMRRFDVPLHSFGIGSRVPEDLEAATKERMLDLIFKITKMKKEQTA